ncbi:MAG TPA: hypothetical protein VJN01_10355, partial [Xanthomonadales bacterium]|nr:hypothetical protein [Xanthomonadales bacterium]
MLRQLLVAPAGRSLVRAMLFKHRRDRFTLGKRKGAARSEGAAINRELRCSPRNHLQAALAFANPW